MPVSWLNTQHSCAAAPSRVYYAVLSAGEISKPNAPHKPLPANAGDEAIARLDRLRNAKGNLRTAEIRRNMQRVMQSDAAVFRTQSSLEEGCDKIDDTVASFADVKVGYQLPLGEGVAGGRGLA